MVPKNSFQTTQKPISNLISETTKPMVPPARLERATYGLEGRRSIQLSYGSIQRATLDVSDLAAPSQILYGGGVCFIDLCEHLVKHFGEVEFACIDHDGIVRNSQRRIFPRNIALVAFVDLSERLLVCRDTTL